MLSENNTTKPLIIIRYKWVTCIQIKLLLLLLPQHHNVDVVKSWFVNIH